MAKKSLVESILEEKKDKDEKVVVTYRIEKSVADEINEIVDENNLKKGDFVSELLKKALKS
ncbi:hypothetical protein [Peribacillus sp. NPDC096448]|uniref:hypothetical protein n=1 Tax=Peribacillus sp. NPDC096448 TaxID=3364395 RepID=UPI0037FFF6C4